MDYIAVDTNSFRYISHHGILGQKWGIRRFQNPDGSYTDQGRKRYSAGDYRRQLNTLDTQVSKAIYQREKYIGKDNVLTRKAMKAQQKGISKEKAQKLLEKHNKYQKLINDHEKLIKDGEALTNKTLASAISRGYSINSKKVNRMVSDGRDAFASASGFFGGVLIGVPVSMIGIGTYNAVRAAQGYSKVGSTGIVEGNKFKVRKTPNGQQPTLRTQLSNNWGYLEATSPAVDERRHR